MKRLCIERNGSEIVSREKNARNKADEQSIDQTKRLTNKKQSIAESAKENT